MNAKILALLAAGSLAIAGAARASVVTFDDVVVSPTNAIQTSVTSDGFDFNGLHFHIINDNSLGTFVDDGTQYLAAEAAGDLGKPVTMTKSGGGTFSLTGADIAEIWMPANNLNSFFDVFFTAVSASGPLSATFTLDGVRDGPGGVADFQHVTFSGWDDLTSVTITGINAAGAFGDYSVDNLSVTTGGGVPEPQSWALMVAGFLGLGAALRARRRTASVTAA